MSENRFLNAGWAAVAAAGLMPVAFIVAGIEDAAFELDVTKREVGIVASDFLLLAFGAVTIYVLIELKRMLYDRYSYRGLDVIIALTVAWTIVNYGGSFLIQAYFTVVGSTTSAGAEAVTTTFWIICIGMFGILDAILGIMLLLQGRRFGMPLQAFAALTLVMGLCGITVILALFNLLLFPVAYIALAVAFLRPQERLEFV